MDYYDLFPDNRADADTPLRQAQLVMLRMLKIIDYICRKHNLSYWVCSGTLLGAVRHKGFIPWDDDLDICMIREDYEKFTQIAPLEFPKDIMLQTRESDPNYDYLPLPCKIRDLNSLIISEGLENVKYNQGLFIDIFPVDRYHIGGLVQKKEKLLKTYFRFITKCLDAKLGKDRSIKNFIISYFNPLFHFLTESYLHRIKSLIQLNNKALIHNQCLIGHVFDTPWRRYFKYSDIYPLQDILFEDTQVMAPNNIKAYLTELYGESYMTPPPENQRIQKHAVILKPILSDKGKF